MEIIRAEIMGYCMGVRRAVEKASHQAQKKEREKLFMAGPIIHNSRVIRQFSEWGVEVLKDESQLEGAEVYIRTHGLPPSVVERYKKEGAEIYDYTCPRVKASQYRIKKRVEEGYFIVIAGDAGHSEVVGLLGYAGKHSAVVATIQEAEELDFPDKSYLLSQTTFSEGEFNEIKRVLLQKNPSLVWDNTICDATAQRQSAVMELAEKCEAIIVVGGLNSSNTKRLKKLAEERVPAWHIEEAEEIPEEIYNYSVVGVTSGASTPDELVDEVIKKLKKH